MQKIILSEKLKKKLKMWEKNNKSVTKSLTEFFKNIIELKLKEKEYLELNNNNEDEIILFVSLKNDANPFLEDTIININEYGQLKFDTPKIYMGYETIDIDKIYINMVDIKFSKRPY
jgi:hypothetical protein